MFTTENLDQALRLFTDKITEQKDYLSELDTPIGDGDHGNNMARGVKGLADSLEEDAESVSDLFKKAAMALMSKVGGASGPLYGSALLEMSKAAQDDTDAHTVLAAGSKAIQNRGKSSPGDKTMVDLWEPAVEEVKEGQLTQDKLESLVEETKDMKAKKGRSSYLGDRSVGHIDPGAMSSKYFFESLLEAGVFDE